ncbi:MAG: 50S ribosomal protein L24 [Clostridia bacterium]|nr:50S ribosomal protein L24 [Clostridia bacterium]
MMKMKIKKDDMALVTAGKEKGKVAEVMECFPKQNKVLLKGLNMIVKHNKPKSAQDKGGIVKKEGTISVSNLMVVCPVCHKATRVKMGLNAKNEKVRLCKKCGATLDSAVKKVVKKKPAVVKTAEVTPVKEEKVAKATAVKTSTKTPAKVASAKVQTHETKSTVKTTRATTVRKSASTAKKIGGK